MVIDLTALRDEIVNDPLAKGYKDPGGSWKGDGTIADLFNQVVPSQAVDRELVPAHEIIAAVDPSEWAALTAEQKRIFQTIAGTGDVNVSAANVRSAFGALFPAGTTTRNNLIALQQRDGNRAEILWGEGTIVHHLDVAAARRL